MGLFVTHSRLNQRTQDEPDAIARAIQWIHTHHLPAGGIVPFLGADAATQEVTGYLIPTLREAGEQTLALDLARWEMSVQGADGSFSAIDGAPYTFDTAQVVRGFLAVLDDLPQVEPHLRRACDFIARQIDAEGRVHTPSRDLWKLADGSTFSEYAHLYVLPPLVAASRRLGEARWADAAQRALDRFKREKELTEFKPALSTLSHIFGYMMEALVELGETALARRGLSQAAAMQQPSGAIAAYPGASWVCATGVAQLAVAWYRLGDRQPADRAVAYLESIQNPSGGFYGGYGRGVTYFPGQEISWAVKFFLDASLWRDGSVASLGPDNGRHEEEGQTWTRCGTSRSISGRRCSAVTRIRLTWRKASRRRGGSSPGRRCSSTKPPTA